MAQSNNILNDSLNSSGSALEEYNVYLDSLEGKIQGFKTAFEAMSSAVADDDFLKGAVDLGTEFLNVLTEIIKNLGGLPTLLSMIVGGYASVKNIGLFKTFETDTNKLSDKIGILGKSFKTISTEVEASLEGVEGRFKRFGTRISSFFKSAFTSPVITQADSTALQQYANALLDGKENSEEITQAMAGVSQSAQYQAKKIEELYKQFKNHEITQEQYIEQSNLAAQSTKKLSLAQKAATITSKALKAALNTIAVIAIIQAVLTIIQKFTEFVNSYSSSIETLKEKNQELEDIKSEIESLNDELATSKQRLIELNAIENPTLIEQEEIDKLKEANEELERQLRLKGYEEFKSANEANADAQANWNDLNSLESTKTNWYDFVPFVSSISALIKTIKDDVDTINVNSNNMRQNYLTDYANAILDRSILNTKYDMGQVDDETYKNELARLENEISERQAKLTDFAQEYTTILNGLDPDDEQNKEAIDFINKFLNKYDYWFNYGTDNGMTRLTSIIKSANYTEVVAKLKELATQGELTIDSFKNTEGIDSFIKALEKISLVVGEDGKLDDSDIQKVIDSIKQISSTSDDGADSIDLLTNSLANFKDTYDKVFSTQSKIQSAFDKIQEGATLTSSEVMELIELCSDVSPEIATLFTQVGDGYTISLEDLKNVNDDVISEIKKDLEKHIEDLKKAKAETHNAILDPANFINNFPDFPKLIESDKKFDEQIAETNLLLTMFGLTADTTEEKIDKLAESSSRIVSNINSVSSAFQEQNENGKLSAATILSLIENGYAAALMYDEQTGAIRLNAEVYSELVKAEIEEQKAALEAAKSEAFTEKRLNLLWSAKERAKGNYELAKSYWEVSLAAGEAYYEAVAHLAILDQYENNLDDVTSGNYGNNDGITEDLNKKLFEQEKALRQHWIAMGKDKNGKKYTEDMYYAWLDSADGYKNYFSDLEKYLDENRQYEEEIYKWKLERDKQFFQEKLDNYNQLADAELNDKEYDDPLLKYRNAAAIIGEAITATQNRINNLVASGSGAVQDEIDDLTDKLGELNDKLAEINDDLWNTRVDNEKEFWEQQKEAVQSYYDNEIKKLQDIEDEQEKINKQEELRLNLIKAQQELLDAKKNRNQLVFHNGTFEYMYDQEAVESAQGSLKNAQDDIAENQRQESINLLEEQRDNAVEFYDKILSMIEAYINKTLPVEASAPEVLGDILNSDYAKAANQEATINNPTNDIKNATKNFKAITLDEFITGLGLTKTQWDKFSESLNIVSEISNMRNPDILEKVVTNNSYVNSNSNQSSVSVGDIYVTVQGGTSDTMINEFAEKLRSKLVTLGIRTQVN